MKFIVALLIIFSSLSVFAQDCKELNLITQKDSPFKKIPLYDQDGLNACYAYAAAQLMDYYLMDNDKTSTSTVSPIWVGVKYAMTDPGKDGISGGGAAAAIQAVRQLGHCDADEANKVLDEFAKVGNIKREELVNILEQYNYLMKKRSLSDFKEEINPKNKLSQSFMKSARQRELYDEAVKRHNKRYCPTEPNFEDLEKLVKSYLDVPTKYILDKLASVDCPKPQKYIVPAAINIILTKNEDVEKQLIAQLKNENAPAGISYCSAIWAKPAFTGTYLRAKDGSSKQWDGCGNHASIVVGMKPVNNQCHFLVRNTWGSQFSKYTSNWKCLCKNKKTKAYVDNCTNKTHNNGEFAVEACWIPSEVMNKNVYGIQTLNPKTK